MQKSAQTQVSIQLTNVLADVVDETGQKILRAIVAGERDGQVLGVFDFVGTQLAECDTEIEVQLKVLPACPLPAMPP